VRIGFELPPGFDATSSDSCADGVLCSLPGAIFTLQHPIPTRCGRFYGRLNEREIATRNCTTGPPACLAMRMRSASPPRGNARCAVYPGLCWGTTKANGPDRKDFVAQTFRVAAFHFRPRLPDGMSVCGGLRNPKHPAEPVLQGDETRPQTGKRMLRLRRRKPTPRHEDWPSTGCARHARRRFSLAMNTRAARRFLHGGSAQWLRERSHDRRCPFHANTRHGGPAAWNSHGRSAPTESSSKDLSPSPEGRQFIMR